MFSILTSVQHLPRPASVNRSFPSGTMTRWVWFLLSHSAALYWHLTRTISPGWKKPFPGNLGDSLGLGMKSRDTASTTRRLKGVMRRGVFREKKRFWITLFSVHHTYITNSFEHYTFSNTTRHKKCRIRLHIITIIDKSLIFNQQEYVCACVCAPAVYFLGFLQTWNACVCAHKCSACIHFFFKSFI